MSDSYIGRRVVSNEPATEGDSREVLYHDLECYASWNAKTSKRSPGCYKAIYTSREIRVHFYC